MYLLMNARHSFMPLSSFQVGSDESLRYAALMMPTPFSGPAGVITAPTEMATFDRKNIGFQLRSCTLRIDCAANLGIAATSSTFTPWLCSVVIWLSIVGSVTSYVVVTTILSNLSPSASFTPAG